MAEAFSVASWNVRNLKDDAWLTTVVNFLTDQHPDAFALYGHS